MRWETRSPPPSKAIINTPLRQSSALTQNQSKPYIISMETQRGGLRGTSATLGLAIYASVVAGWVDDADAATIRDDVADAQYIGLGQSPEYSSVGTFVNNQSFNGSAVLIAPDWVLTAAHLFRFASSGTFTINGSSYTSSALITHPMWNGNAFAGYDFGLIQLSSPVLGVTPTLLYTGSNETGMTGTFIGYGMTGNGLSGALPGVDGNVRGFQNVIDGDFGNPGVLLGSDFDNPLNAAESDFGSPIPLALEGSVANGDSGGGVFINVNGTTYLSGIVSFVAARDGSANSDYGDVNGFGRISAALPWIISTTNVPEPSSTALVILGAALLYGRARHRTAFDR
jgi:hypothetical protein